MSQACSVPAQPSPALPAPLERGCELSEPHVRQLHSQGFFVHCLLNHSPSWSIFSLVMHYLQMLVETKSTLDVAISFLSASQDIDSWVIFCWRVWSARLILQTELFPGLSPDHPREDWEHLIGTRNIIDSPNILTGQSFQTSSSPEAAKDWRHGKNY